MALAIDTIIPSYQRMVKTLFPINIKYWLKLGLVSLISGGGSGGGGRNNLNLNRSFNDSKKIIDFITTHWVFLLSLFSGVYFLALGFAIIRSIFVFIFFGSVLEKKVEIKAGFRRHLSKGFSLFLFQFVLGLSTLAFFIVIALPIALPIISNLDNLSWGLISIPYLIFAIFVFVIVVFALAIFYSIVRNFVIPDMFILNSKIIASIKRVFRLAKTEKLEILLYLLMKMLLGMALGIISLLAAIILLVPFALVAAAIVIPLILLGIAINSYIVPIILGIPIGIIWFVAYSYAIAVVLLPLPVFFLYYKLLMLLELNKKRKNLLGYGSKELAQVKL